MLALVGGIASVITIVAIKIGAGLLVGTVASSIAGAFFGGPMDRLPPDLRQQYEQRLQTAIGSRLDGVQGQARDRQVQSWIRGGLLRLDDARLVHRLQLEVDAIFAVDEPTCAGFARLTFTGETSTDISRRVLSALDTAKLGEWIGMNVEAIEVELRATPDQQRASDSAIDRAFDRLLAAIAEPTAKRIIALADGIPASDAESCSAVRTFYGAAMNLDDTSRNVIARYDVQSLE